MSDATNTCTFAQYICAPAIFYSVASFIHHSRHTQATLIQRAITLPMYRTAAVVVGAPKQLIPAVCAAAGLVKEVMYVPVASKLDQTSLEDSAILKPPLEPSLGELSHWVEQMFLQVSKLNPSLDLRVLLPRPPSPSLGSPAPSPPSPPPSPSPPPPLLQHKVDALLSTASSYKDAVTLPSYQMLARRTSFDLDTPSFNQLQLSAQPVLPPQEAAASHAHELKASSDVALGGTFDYIHNGHRLLLTQAALVATNRILVGVANGILLKDKKTLSELIKPVEERIAEVEALIRDIQPELCIEVVPITDVYGPTAWDEKREGLVVSAETVSGGDKVNEERKRRVSA